MEANPLRRMLTAKATVFVGLALLVAVVVGMISVASVSKHSEAQQQPPAFGAREVINAAGPLPVTGTYTSKGGTLIVSAAGSGFSNATNQKIGMTVFVEGRRVGTVQVFTNEQLSHKAFVPAWFVVRNVPRGQTRIELEAAAQTQTDQNDFFRVTVLELPRR